MKTVLGLALTSTDVSWVLLAGGDATDHVVLDDDAFAVDDGDELAGRAVAAARGAQAIAASSGHEVRSVGVTGEDDIVAEADKLIASLKSMSENAALRRNAFLISSAVTYGYSPYSRKLGT